MSDSNSNSSVKPLGDYQTLLDRFNFKPEDLLVHLKPLEVRRLAILGLRERGLSERAIAFKLNISRRTVRDYPLPESKTDND